MIAPKGLARIGVHTDNISAAGTRVEDTLAIAGFKDGRGIRTVFRSGARLCGPERLAGALVKGIEAIAGGTLASPETGDAACDDHVTINDRRARTSIGKGQATVALHETVLP